MSTITESDPAIEPAANAGYVQPTPPNNERSRAMPFIAGLGVAAALAAGIYFLNDSDNSATDPAIAATSTTEIQAPVSDSDPAAAPAAPVATDPAVTRASFSQAWLAGDFDTMATVASADAVATASEWYQTDATMSGCVEISTATCQVVYGDNSGFGLIFNITMSNDGAMVSGLTFQGDAG